MYQTYCTHSVTYKILIRFDALFISTLQGQNGLCNSDGWADAISTRA